MKLYRHDNCIFFVPVNIHMVRCAGFLTLPCVLLDISNNKERKASEINQDTR